MSQTDRDTHRDATHDEAPGQNTNDTRNRLRAALLTGTALALMAITAPASAYVGPGAGLSLLGGLWAFIVAVFGALFFVVAWPVRKMMRQRKQAEPPKHRSAGDPGPQA